MRRICTTLAAHGYRVLLVGRCRKQSAALTAQPYAQVRLKPWLSKGKFFYVEFNLRLLLFLLRTPFDVVCGIDLDTLGACWLAARIKKKVCVYDAHEIFPEVPEVSRRPLVRFLWRCAERFLVGRVPYGYTVSASVSEYFRQRYGRQYAVVRNVPLLIETNHNASQSPSSPPIILYQGALNEGRCLEMLITLMKHVDAQLWLAGTGDRSECLRQLVWQHKLENKVRFLGGVQPEALPAITVQAYLGVNLLEKRSASYYYSLANKFFDYVHAGIPQITMNFPEYRKHTQQWPVAWLLDECTPSSLLEAVRCLLTDRPLYENMRSHCLLARQVWNWQHEQQIVLDLYHKL